MARQHLDSLYNTSVCDAVTDHTNNYSNTILSFSPKPVHCWNLSSQFVSFFLTQINAFLYRILLHQGISTVQNNVCTPSAHPHTIHSPLPAPNSTPSIRRRCRKNPHTLRIQRRHRNKKIMRHLHIPHIRLVQFKPIPPKHHPERQIKLRPRQPCHFVSTLIQEL